MCRPASFVLTKQKVFWGLRTESHEQIIADNKLREMTARNNPSLVRVEVVPPGGDWNAPLRKWEYHLDQDILPAWYDAEDCERRAKHALKDWYKAKVVKQGEVVASINGESTKTYVCGTVNEVRDNGTVNKVWGNGTVNKVWGNGTVNEVRDNGTVNEVWDNGTVNRVRDNGTVNDVWGNGTVNKVWGNGTVNEVWGNGTVNEVRDNGTVNKVWGNGTVTTYNSLSDAILKSKRAVLIDRSSKKVQCYVGNPA